jgi:hypothetical protein
MLNGALQPNRPGTRRAGSTDGKRRGGASTPY